MAQVYVYGDSITYGICDKNGGWVSRLRRYIDKKYRYEWVVFNLGIPGDTTEDLLTRISFETEQRLRADEPERIYLFAVGINDTKWTKRSGKNAVSADRFERNITKIISLSKKYSKNIIILGITPVDESRTSPVTWNPDIYYKNEYIVQYENMLAAVCKKQKSVFLPLFKTLTQRNFTSVLYDGLHPDTNEHRYLFEEIKHNLTRLHIL